MGDHPTSAPRELAVRVHELVKDYGDTRAIDNFIVRLRRYIEDGPAAPKFLQTVRGVGYKLVDTSS